MRMRASAASIFPARSRRRACAPRSRRADIPGRNDIAPIRSDEPLLPVDLVEYEGQPVAAIAAETLDQARAAAKLVDIEYEPLPAVLTVEDAIAREQFVSPPQTIARGDVAAGARRRAASR